MEGSKMGFLAKELRTQNTCPICYEYMVSYIGM